MVYLTPSLKIVLIKINISVRECWARCPAERRGDVIHYPGVIQGEGQKGRQRKREERDRGEQRERRGRHRERQM